MASALNNLQRVDMPLNKETKPLINVPKNYFYNILGKGMDPIMLPVTG